LVFFSKQNAQIFTEDRTLILMSFPMRDHGGHFAQWLRGRLMTHYKLASVRSVYCDVVASRHIGSQLHLNVGNGWWDNTQNTKIAQHRHNAHMQQAYGKIVQAYQAMGETVVAPDHRPTMMESGSIASGAMSKDWNFNFLEAMAQAKVMLFIINPDYTSSEHCIREWKQFRNEHKRRKVSGQPPLRGVVLRFSGASLPVGMDYTGMDVLAVNRAQGGDVLGRQTTGDQAAHNAYSLSEGDFQSLVRTIGPLP